MTDAESFITPPALDGTTSPPAVIGDSSAKAEAIGDDEGAGLPCPSARTARKFDHDPTDVSPPIRRLAREGATDAPPGFRLNANLVPTFEYPASTWMRQVARVLMALGLDQYKGKTYDRVVVPILLAKMPSELSTVAPIGSLEELSDFLCRFDAPVRGLKRIQELAVKRDERPSIAFARMCEEMSETWDKLPKKELMSLAWEIVRDSLPLALRLDYTIAKIVLPTPRELDTLDSLYLANKENENRSRLLINQVNTQGVSRSFSQPPLSGEGNGRSLCSKNDDFDRRLSSIEKLLQERLPMSSTQTVFPVDNSRQTGFYRSVQSSGQAGKSGEAKNFWGEGSNRYCYYHSHFADLARKCQEPCAYVKDKQTGSIREEYLVPRLRTSTSSKNAHPNG